MKVVRLSTICVVLMLIVTGTASAGTNNPYYRYMVNHRAAAQKMCRYYFILINQGWSNSDIYEVLDDAGTFDNYYGQGHTAFKALVTYCFRYG